MQAILVEIVRLSYEGLVFWLVWVGWTSRGEGGRVWQRVEKAGRHWQRHAQSPRECPVCRAAHGTCEEPATRQTVEAWRKQKSQRGRPKTVSTDGYSCPNRQCLYYGITDEQVHALVGDGVHHDADAIQYLRCQACGSKFSSRHGTPMYDLKTPVKRVDEVMTATSEGVDISAASRIFKHDQRTIQRWLERTGNHARRLHQHFFHDLVCAHLPLDELVTKLRGLQEHLFVWVALDAQTKIMPVIHVGRRRHDDAIL